jgi:hypothetical protein
MCHFYEANVLINLSIPSKCTEHELTSSVLFCNFWTCFCLKHFVIWLSVVHQPFLENELPSSGSESKQAPVITETIEIENNPSNVNGEAGLCLNKSWIPLPFSLKECQKPPQDFS